MITLQEVLRYHNQVILATGGADGVRDKSILESALARPFQSFEGKELYPSIIEKVAALMESLIVNHPFIDGNKRIGYILSRLLLLEYGFDIIADEENKYTLIIAIASGETHYDDIINWLKIHTQKL